MYPSSINDSEKLFLVENLLGTSQSVEIRLKGHDEIGREVVETISLEGERR